ncbi:solute carrier family 13 (sodium-dependent dicarboxylate transporter), member 2/3/5 [Desulfonatronum thiosulfatophilum]|uniref:Solute carrier family 13 (Sodium-dependent dicarboxylate transporter), member 2/3/5 n=1 Tax=Desulfonatronum thiosulfatophilum TaxID=617002 RepID=A0A1G6D5Z8_9BACT|nr:SLC13 family permease [Desulfonatronum thiosulfatophilum]SDB40596.1 solute carrier family 13 (sodium-dependent dicarboxylate transporter), member 2/3/5 [Desulfonatronum thiosulfatophilum]
MTAAQATPSKIDFRRLFFLFLGLFLFTIVYASPPWPNAIDPMGKEFMLSPEGKAALALFLLAGTWWVFEVVPIGITGLTIGVVQALFFIRPASAAFKDFMDPSVLFIFGSLVIGMVFTKVGITKRLAYKMLIIVGERTSMIYLGCFVVTALLTHLMAHTAVAATMYPLLLSIYALYGEGDKPTKFGKGLFIGMAFVAGAGSIITLLGAARGIVALGFYQEITGQEISFFELTYYMFPIGWLMVFVLWGFFMVFLKPEKAVIPGLRDKARQLSAEMGPISRNEIISASIIFGVILFLSLQSFIPALADFNKAAVLLVSTILFFILRILDIKDLEDIPWNIILLFAGAMSMGFCLWQTGAAEWLAINWLGFFSEAHWFVFVIAIAFFVMIMTNFIMNVAAIAISVPVALVVAPYLGVAPEVIVFAALVTAGMPFLLLVGAAPNAIAYNSKQFTSGEFFAYGIPASILLMALVALAVLLIWPLLGMPILTN